MRRLAAPLAVLVTLVSFDVAANVPLVGGLGGPRGYGTDCLSPNDDGSSSSIDLRAAFPQGLRFFSDTHTSAFVNTNGNITFSGAEPVFTPQAFPVASRPMIAAYWGDVDLRPIVDGDCRGIAEASASSGSGACQNPTTNGAWWHLEPGKMTITWDRVGYYRCQLDKLMDFQMVLTAPPPACGVAAGDFDVEFRFNQCDWTTGDASGGSNGLGGTPAQVGFDAGDEQNFVQIPGSMTSTIHTIACTDSNISEPGRWFFQIRGGAVLCPEAGEACDTGDDGVCGIGRTRCVGAGTECVAAVEPSAERCNAVDDDCDGQTDEGEGLCPDGGVCDRGVCVFGCSEIGCLGVDEACEDVTCDEGLRCIGGECVEACEGVVCPTGAECRGGRCVEACANIGCDECSVCQDGVCEVKCTDDDACGAGKACLPDGRCVESACATVSCDAGSFCEAGACKDACDGAVCPTGETCVRGACTGPGQTGEGEGEGREGEGEGEGGRSPADDDEGEGEGGTFAGCGCTSGESAALPGALLLLLAGLRRRRRRL